MSWASALIPVLAPVNCAAYDNNTLYDFAPENNINFANEISPNTS
jgi:kievitone hydratase